MKNIPTKKILIVEDQVDYLKLLVEFAEIPRMVTEVITAKNGREAWELFRQHQDEIILVVTDNTLDMMIGVELTCRIKKIKPKTPVVLVTSDSPKSVRGHRADIYLPRSTTPYQIFKRVQQRFFETSAVPI